MKDSTYTSKRVYRAPVDVQVVLRKDLRAFINSSSRPVKDTAKHVLGDTKFEALAREFDFGLQISATVLYRH
jgi:hypothetical protein